VSITVREMPSLWIDKRVLDGTFAVPIAPASRGTPREQPLEPHGRITLSLQLGVMTDTDVLPATGGIVAIGTGPAVLAVGKGRLLVRTRDGADILEAEDPRTVTVLPVERGIDACAEELFGAEFPVVPAGLVGAVSVPVESITRDDDGCRVFHLSENGVPLEYRACVPDAAYPFADTDAISFSSLATDSVRFAAGSGASLELVPVRFQSRRPVNAAGMMLGSVTQATCTTVDAACSDVVLPAKVVVSFDGKTSVTHVIGDSFSNPNDATHTFFVLGARSRVVVDPGCAARDTRGAFAPSDIFFAVVQKPVP
jgi:hypothetical protein